MRSTRNGLKELTIASFVLACLISNVAFGQSDAYFAKRIWTGQGEPIENGVMLVVNGKITAVGTADQVKVPARANRHQLKNQVIMPGIVAAQTNLVGTADVAETVTPEIQAVDGFDFFKDYQEMIRAGITSAQVSSGNQRLVPGVCGVVKLSGEDPSQRLLMEQESLRVILTSASRNPPTIFKPAVGPVSVDRPLLPTKPQLSRSLTGAITGLRMVMKSESKSSDYAPFVSGKKTVRFTAETTPEIRGALQLAKEFDLQVILADAKELKTFKDSFKDWKRVKGVVLKGLTPGVISNPTPDSVDETTLPWEYARELIDANVPVSIRPASDGDLKHLMFVAAQFMQDDLDRSEIVSMLTAWPAKMMGVADRVGTLEKGRDGDFLILNEDPFQLRTKINATYVSGKKVFDRKQKLPTQVIRASKVYTGNGHIIEDGTLVVKGKTIRGIGTDASAPLDADEKDFGDAVIVPGFVDFGSSIGIGGPVPSSVSLRTKLGDQLYVDDPAVKIARRTGVSTVLMGALNSSGITPLVAFKLGDDLRVISDPVAIQFTIADNPTSSIASIERSLKSGKAYHDSWIKYEKDLAAYNELIAKTPAKTPEKSTAKPAEKKEEKPAEKKEEKPADKKESDEKDKDKPKDDSDKDDKKETESKKEGEKSSDSKDKKESTEKKAAAPKGPTAPKKPTVQTSLEPYRLLFAGKIPAFVKANKSPAIKAALKLFRQDNDLRTVIVGVKDLARFQDLLTDKKVAVCIDSNPFITIDDETTNLPQLLANERIPFGFQSKATTGIAQLPGVVQFSVSQGLGVSDGLNALTSNVTQILSNKMTFGNLKSGNDADLVVLSGPPFDFSTRVLAVMIDGVWVYEKEEKE